jgi:hypothetical protein
MLYEARQFVRRIIPSTDTHFGVSFATGAIPYQVLLIHADEPNGSKLFYDSARRHNVVNGNNSVQVTTAQSVFGGASALFTNGSGNSGLQLDGSPDFAYGTRDFTIDFRVRFNSLPASLYYLYDARYSGSGSKGIMYVMPDGHIEFGNGTTIVGTQLLTTATWYHIAVTRASGVSRLFIDGTQDGASTADTTNYVVDIFRPMFGDGATGGGTQALDGWMDEIRILNGQAAWVANFTPPVAPYSPP